MNLFNFDLPSLIANVPALLIGFAFHEFAHAWMADRLGDPTPRLTGRLTLNPVAHLDIFGTLMALFYRFGWAKPVLINPNNFRGNPLRSEMLVALAGPVMNLLIAFVSMLLWVLTLHWLYGTSWAPVISEVFMAIVFMNLGLGVFNLIPIPPLDGFSVVGGILPSRFAGHFWAIKQYGMFILIFFLFTNVLGRIISPAVMFLFNLYQTVTVLILSPLLK